MFPLGYIRQSEAATFCIFHYYESLEKLNFHDAHKNRHFCGPILPIHNTCCDIKRSNMQFSLYTWQNPRKKNSQGATVIGIREHSL